jgi:hypothetical protein
VHIGDRLLGASKTYNPRGHFEDRDFLDLNVKILHAAGGNWCDPPPPHAILQEGRRFKIEIADLVLRKTPDREHVWGWKDPRNCLVAPLYYLHLIDPHWVVVRRDPEAIHASLKQRGPHREYRDTMRDYFAAIEWVLRDYPAPIIELQFENLVNRDRAPDELARLADFVGTVLPENLAEERIIWRD